MDLHKGICRKCNKVILGEDTICFTCGYRTQEELSPLANKYLPTNIRNKDFNTLYLHHDIVYSYKGR